MQNVWHRKNLRGWVYPPLVDRRLTLPFLFFSSFFSSPFFFLLVFIRIALFPFLLVFTLPMSPYVLLLCHNSCVSRSIGVGVSWPQDFGLEVVEVAGGRGGSWLVVKHYYKYMYLIMYRKYVRKWWLFKRNRIICPEFSFKWQILSDGHFGVND